MTFWIDEQISPKFATWLKHHFSVETHSVDSLGFFSALDREIFEKAFPLALDLINSGEPLVEIANSVAVKE